MARQTARLGLAAGSILCAAALIGGPAAAHHSSALYDREKPLTLKGVVKNMQWSNPHGWIEVLGAADGGKPMEWTIEMEGPNVMQREGWSRNSLTPGERITVRVMPLKDGRPGARLIDVIKADGTVLHLFTPRAVGA
jgi:hypothetical protein